MVSGPILLLLLAIAVALIIVFTGKYKVHAFLVLLGAAYFVGVLSGMGLSETVDAIAAGFGGTLKSIGIVIAAGTIIGHILFCDSGFVILSPLNKALTKRAGLSMAVTAVALSTGLYATHTLVPPTPGPIAAAANLNADLGLVIMLGLIASIPAALAGFPSHPFGEGILKNFFDFIGHPITALLLGVLLSFKLVDKLDEHVYGPKGWVAEGLKNALQHCLRLPKARQLLRL
ncbi:MAG: gluconate:H+ symporter, GntP family [Thermococcaceae archaeon]|nr:gluconate:H+ symporter, GntP family [Thermococcaceae archaeon]